MCFGDDCPGGLNRREIVIGATAALGAAMLLPRAAGADPPPPTRVLDDPRIEHKAVTFTHGGSSAIGGYLARPKADGVFPLVVVIAGNRIVEEYIPNTCAALALGGFVGLAPDIFHIVPDSAQTPAEIAKVMAAHPDVETLQDVQLGADWARAQSFVRGGGYGVIGFCAGGRNALLLGNRSREVDAIVPFHPGAVTREEIARLRAPVQIHSGTADRHVSVESVRKLESMLRARKVSAQLFLYEGADHGFLAYTRPYYRPDHARVAWDRTLSFLRRHLRG